MTYPRRSSLAAAALLCASAAANAIFAQRADQATIPRDLAAAFVHMYVANDTSGAVDFAPDSMPPSIASIVEIPPGARLLGTVSVGTTAYVIGFVASFWLPEPTETDLPD